MDPTQQFLQAEAQRAAQELGVKTDDTPNVEQAPQPQPQEAAAQPVAPPAPEGEQPPATPATPATPGEQPQAPAEIPPKAEGQPPVISQTEEEDEEFDIPTFNPYPAYQQQSQQLVEPSKAETPQQPQQPPAPPAQTPQLDPAQFTDQYGNVDMGRFAQAMRMRDEALISQVTSNLTNRLTTDIATRVTQQAQQYAERVSAQQIMAAKAEERAWEQTFAKYPQVKENKDLRDLIHKMRLGEVAVTGKPASPRKIADRYFAQIAQAREDGVRQAVETTKVQASAHLETANNTASEKGLKAQQDWSRIASRDRREATESRTAVLRQMLSDGLL